MNYVMPCLITAFKRSATNKSARTKLKKQAITAKDSISKFKTPRNNVKMQSDKALSTQILLFCNYTADGNFPY